jgi:restriction endonuclease S subunit
MPIPFLNIFDYDKYRAFKVCFFLSVFLNVLKWFFLYIYLHIKIIEKTHKKA